LLIQIPVALAVDGQLEKVVVYYFRQGIGRETTFTENGSLAIDQGSGASLAFRIYRTSDGSADWNFWGSCGNTGWYEDHATTVSFWYFDPESNYSWYAGDYFLGVDNDWLRIIITEAAFQRSDLVISEPRPDNGSVTPPFRAGYTIDWYFTVNNIGQGSTVGSFYVQYYLGTSPDDYSHPIGLITVSPMNAGWWRDIHDSYMFQESDIGTQRYLNAWADYDNGIMEENEYNTKRPPTKRSVGFRSKD